MPGGGRLAAQQDEDSSRYGEQPHDHAQAREAQAEQCNQPVQDEEDCQQQEAYIFGKSHSGAPLKPKLMAAFGSAILVNRQGGYG